MNENESEEKAMTCFHCNRNLAPYFFSKILFNDGFHSDGDCVDPKTKVIKLYQNLLKNDESLKTEGEKLLTNYQPLIGFSVYW